MSLQTHGLVEKCPCGGFKRVGIIGNQKMIDRCGSGIIKQAFVFKVLLQRFGDNFRRVKDSNLTIIKGFYLIFDERVVSARKY